MNDMVGISGELESSGNGSGTAFGHCSCCCRCKDCGGLAGSAKIQFQLSLKAHLQDAIFFLIATGVHESQRYLVCDVKSEWTVYPFCAIVRAFFVKMLSQSHHVNEP